jgi:hypothetical protein
MRRATPWTPRAAAVSQARPGTFARSSNGFLTGGFGSVLGNFFGTITFSVVNQGIYFTSFDRNWSSLIIGVMLLLAVLMNNTFRKMALSYSPRKK